MAEYIRLVKRVKYAGDVHAELLKAGWDLETATLFVNNIQDADVAPVVHGRWLPYQTPIETRQSGWICNQCSGVAHDVSNGDTDYCPNCGAKMDGGADT